MSQHLFQYFREGGLIDLDELLQLVQVIAEKLEPFVECHIYRRQL